ncbi:MAG: DNA alkylation repair [Planctomycetota bacterium]|nr:MAG: DNA alkylation repair [Planctomycetota bacterium]
MTFFKSGPGEYGEGDEFIGLSTPQVRGLVKRFRGLPDTDVAALVRSRIHEERALGLMYLVDRYRCGDAPARARIYRAYLSAFPFINNWDLVDGTAEHIVGAHLEKRGKAPLWKWARSKRLWDRRIAMLATFAYIKRGRFTESLRLLRMFLGDTEDLMHKACGWMLREIGKRDGAVLRRFLGANVKRMPRTMLRYAIERFPGRERKAWLAR